MTRDVKKSVVRITSADVSNSSFGTAFVIAKRGGTCYLLTCAHVLRDVGGPGKALAAGMEAQVIVAGDETGVDLAVLAIQGLPDLPILPLGEGGETGCRISTAGFQVHDKGLLLRPLQGQLGSRIALERRVGQTRIDAWDLHIDGDYRLQPGYSGSPLLDESSGRVLGIVSHRENQGQRGQAISVRALDTLWTTPLPGLFDAQMPLGVEERQTAAPLMNLKEELDAFRRIASGKDTGTRLILVQGPSGMGKSRLLEEYLRVAQQNRLETLLIPLDQQITIDNCLSQLVYRLGVDQFPEFDATFGSGRLQTLTRDQELSWFRSLTMKFFRDLRKSQEPAVPLVVFFDPYEKADREIKQWLSRDFVPAVCSTPRLIAVVAGQESVNPRPSYPEHRHFDLSGVTVDWYFRYAADCGVELEPGLVTQFHELLHGRPKEFVEYVQAKVAGGTIA